MKFLYQEYNEIKQHGSMGFPIQLYCLDHTHPRYVMPLHWHKEAEIIRVISGCLDLYINNTLHILKSGDIAFINCKQLIRAEPNNCIYECIVFDLEYMAKKSSIIYSDYIYPLATGILTVNCLLHKENSLIYNGFTELFNTLSEEAPFYRLSVMRNLYTVFEELFKNGYIEQSNLSSRKSKQTAVMLGILNWIEENYAEAITLEDLASRCMLTPNHFCRTFKAYTGKTPIEYVNFVRIQNVLSEIKLGEKNITRIATDNGFNDMSYFCKVFKKEMGVSAKKYAKNIKER